jgi:hypothetical protein
MRYPIAHRPRGRSAFSAALVVLAATALLLSLATSASAESNPVASVVSELAAESSATSQVATVPAEIAESVDTPEPAEAPAEVEAPAAPDVVKTAAATVEAAASGLDSVTEEAQSRVAHRTADVAHRTADLVETAGNAYTPPDLPLRQASEVLRHETQGLVSPNRVQDLLPRDGALPEGSNLNPLSLLAQPDPPAPELPSAPAVARLLQPSGPGLNQRTTLLDHLFTQRVTNVGGIEPLRFMLEPAGFSAGRASLASLDSVVTSPLGGATNSQDAAPDRNGDQPNPTPSLPAPQAGASGSAPSSFVPIVALLALLALAAPAIRRRPWEGPVCSPLVPFVCALERPG